jgi:hypothetical protein
MHTGEGQEVRLAGRSARRGLVLLLVLGMTAAAFSGLATAKKKKKKKAKPVTTTLFSTREQSVR